MKSVFVLLILFLFNYAHAQNSRKFSEEPPLANPLSPQQQKVYEKLKREHVKWKLCIVIKGPDSLFCKIKPQDAYSGGNSWSAKEITIAYPNEIEWIFNPKDYSALLIKKDTGMVKYISIPLKDTAYNGLFKIIVEGKCNLLFAQRMKFSPTGITGVVAAPYYESHYYTYYNNILTLVTEDGVTGTSLKFKSVCEQVFAGCPTLVSKIENRIYKVEDLPKIVREFNLCIEKP